MMKEIKRMLIPFLFINYCRFAGHEPELLLITRIPFQDIQTNKLNLKAFIIYQQSPFVFNSFILHEKQGYKTH